MTDSIFATGPYSGQSTAAQSCGFPAILNLDRAEELIRESPSSAPLLGVDGTGDPVSIDLDSDSPHVLVNAATGGGKSALMRSMTAQILARGGLATVLDLKRHSHRWTKGLPNVAYAKTIPEIGNALVELGLEVHRRNEIVENFDGPVEEAPVGPRLVIVFEEMNATMGQLQAYARNNRSKARTEYSALDGLNDVMFMGRAAKVHILANAQYATNQAVGGGDIRENFATRVLLRYSEQAWRMLAGIWPPLPAPEEPGRGMVVRAGKARQTQFLYLTEEEARAMVLESPEALLDPTPPPPMPQTRASKFREWVMGVKARATAPPDFDAARRAAA